MKREVWKYTLENSVDKHCLKIPAGAKLLHVGKQCKDICLWFEVDTDITFFDERSFEVFWTGECIEYGNHIGTVISIPYVFHVYETTKEN